MQLDPSSQIRELRERAKGFEFESVILRSETILSSRFACGRGADEGRRESVRSEGHLQKEADLSSQEIPKLIDNVSFLVICSCPVSKLFCAHAAAWSKHGDYAKVMTRVGGEAGGTNERGNLPMSSTSFFWFSAQWGFQVDTCPVWGRMRCNA